MEKSGQNILKKKKTFVPQMKKSDGFVTTFVNSDRFFSKTKKFKTVLQNVSFTQV